MNTKLVGKSIAIQNAVEFITRAAKTDTSVLLLAPTGSGKELIARAIHESGPRCKHPFVVINCASLNPNLIESELFGHEKGAFTDAAKIVPGKFELADGGTLFLDELGDLPLPLQAKFLRVLQEKEFFRLGGDEPLKSNVRVISATHQPLYEMTKQKLFREDLYYRLNVLSFTLPALKDRQEDLPELIEYFQKSIFETLGVNLELAPQTTELLKAYDFPGNVRELRNILERLAVMGEKNRAIEPELLPLQIRDPKAITFPPTLSSIGNLWRGSGIDAAMEKIEMLILTEALTLTGNNSQKAAVLLKVDRGTLRYRLKKYDLWTAVSR